MHNDRILNFRHELAILGQHLIDAALDDSNEFSVADIVNMAEASLYSLAEECHLTKEAIVFREASRAVINAIEQNFDAA